MPGAGKLWDHASGRYVHAQCLVTSHYVDPDRDYPIGLRQYFKHGSQEADEHGFTTKIEQATELIDECEELGVPAENQRLRLLVPLRGTRRTHRGLREGLGLPSEEEQDPAHPRREDEGRDVGGEGAEACLQ